VEGYLVQDPMMFKKALRLASQAGLKICLDLASFNVVAEYADFFKNVIRKYVDILFANEEEIKAFTGKSPEEGAKEAKELCESCGDQTGGRRFILRVCEQGEWSG
jgi:sugar/nucleoside kinase (ribokinase family)